jgi:hypothetical protein
MARSSFGLKTNCLLMVPSLPGRHDSGEDGSTVRAGHREPSASLRGVTYAAADNRSDDCAALRALLLLTR